MADSEKHDFDLRDPSGTFTYSINPEKGTLVVDGCDTIGISVPGSMIPPPETETKGEPEDEPKEPEDTPPPPPEAIAGYHARSEDPDFEIIRGQMRSYADRLPASEAEAIATNEVVFNELYDRTAKAYREHARAAQRAAEYEALPPHVRAMLLESREVKRKAAEAPAPEDTRDARYRAAVARAAKAENHVENKAAVVDAMSLLLGGD